MPPMIAKCYLCNSVALVNLPGQVRDRSDIGILECSDCGLVFLDTHEHITDEYYQKDYSIENHAHLDHDSFLQESAGDDERRFQQIRPLLINKRYLDIGCGGGGVLLKSAVISLSSSGVEPQVIWQEALNKRGIKVFPDVRAIGDREFDVITLFHVLEHIQDPRQFLAEIFKIAAKGARLIIEVPNADDALLKLYENEPFANFTYWSAHLFLYNAQTLAMLLSQVGCKSWDIQQYQRYPLSNHLRWLAKGEPAGHISWQCLDSVELNAAYADKLAELSLCDTLIAYVSID